MIDIPHSSRITVSRRRILAGFVAGFLPGSVLATVLEPWVLGLILGPLFGTFYTFAFSADIGSELDHSFNAAALAVPGWVLVQITAVPLFQEGTPAWTPETMGSLLPILTAWVVAGILFGAVVPTVSAVIGGNSEPPAEASNSTTSSPKTDAETRIVILGGGFAGLYAAKRLEERFGPDPTVSITLVSEHNAILFTPMLAEVAAGSVEPTHITSPLRTSLRRTDVIQAAFTGFDVENNRVLFEDRTGIPDSKQDHEAVTADGQPNDPRLRSGPATRAEFESLPYDHVILALGSVTDRKGVGEDADFVFDFKTLQDAARLRNHVISCFERAEREVDPTVRAELVTFVIAGAGFAGAELAGSLNDFVRGILIHYPNIPPDDVSVSVVHSRDRIMPELSDTLAEYATTRMRERGVSFVLGARVDDAADNVVSLSTGEEIRTRTLVWTAGSRPNPLIQSLDIPQTEYGEVEVDEDLSVPNHDDIWAAGDSAAVTDASGERYPNTAEHAIRAAEVLADNVHASVTDGKSRRLEYDSPGSLAVIGYQTACAEIRGLCFSGLFAWLMWRAVYLFKLPGTDRKIRVLIDWLVEVIFPRDIVQTLEYEGQKDSRDDRRDPSHSPDREVYSDDA